MTALMTSPVLSSLRKEMDRLFERVWDGNLEMPALGDWIPVADVVESAEALTVKMEIPGIELKDIQVTLKDTALTVRGEKKQEIERKDAKFFRHERSYGYFARSVQLPTTVDPNKVKATFKNGVLTVVLEKAPEARGTAVPVIAG